MPNGKPGPASPFDQLWESEIPEILRHDPDGKLTNAGILDTLMQRHPQQFATEKRTNLLTTLGRQVKRWRSANGYAPRPARPRSAKRHAKPPGMVFPQEHPPGGEAQVAFTDGTELLVTVQGEPFPHRLYNFRLSHSGWSHVEVVEEEISQAVAPCLQRALARLGVAPKVLRTDYTNGAIKNGEPPDAYNKLMKQHRIRLSLANPRRPWELGGVRSGNNQVKRAIEQALLVRGSRDFDDIASYRRLVQQTTEQRNERPEIEERRRADLAAMRLSPHTPMPV
ncbi:MAG: hypothetical protein OXF79_04695 [Chloroflexi bacterium]|nr:hypothetical protein [Chloroflexota bacterium]